MAAAAAAAEAAEAAEAAALALAAEAAQLAAEAAEAAELAAQLGGELAGESEAAARRGELAAGARADRLPIALTNAGPYGRVRQKRTGQSMSCLQRCPRVAGPCLTAEWFSSGIEKCQRAREFQWSENMPCESEPESWARCALLDIITGK